MCGKFNMVVGKKEKNGSERIYIEGKRRMYKVCSNVGQCVWEGAVVLAKGSNAAVQSKTLAFVCCGGVVAVPAP